MTRNSFRGVNRRIGAIKFSCLSPEEIRKMSAVKVITPDTYDDENRPYERGLMDLHMGVIEPGLRCKTCGCNSNDCPGHFGHIELARPVIHVGFIKEIKMLLECTCSSCGKLLLTDDQIELIRNKVGVMENSGSDPDDLKELFKRIHKESLTKKACPHCGEEQVKIKLDKPTTFRAVDDNHKLETVLHGLENFVFILVFKSDFHVCSSFPSRLPYRSF